MRQGDLRRVKGALVGVSAMVAAGWLAASARAPAQASSSPQEFVAPQGRVENVRFDQPGGGVVHVWYDLVSGDASALFNVTLEVSLDGGATFDRRARSVTGDVGPKVSPGAGKRIVWEYGRDVERLQIDRFRFRVLTEAGTARPATPTVPKEPLARAAPVARAGTLSVVTKPAGAAVTINGKPHPTPAPFQVSEFAEGEYVLVASLQGFLDQRRMVRIQAGQSTNVELSLTPLKAAAATGTPSAAGAPKKGRNKLIYILPIAGGAAVAAAAAGGGGGGSSTTTPSPTPTPTNRQPSAGTLTVSPSTGLAGGTVSFAHSGASDPDGDPLSCVLDWAGPGESFSEIPSSRKVGGSFSCGLTLSVSNCTTDDRRYRVAVSDGRSSVVFTSTATVTWRSMTGTWTGTISTSTGSISFTLSLSQTTSSAFTSQCAARDVVTGTFTGDNFSGLRIADGNIDSPRSVFLLIPQSRSPSRGDIVLTGELDPTNANRVTGQARTYYSGPFTMTRP